MLIKFTYVINTARGIYDIRKATTTNHTKQKTIRDKAVNITVECKTLI